ncbi:hypothetical protein ACH5RR_003420 [Cinchona calisaya]|uniref:Uncharacterized protein n=1 Tax=Cinchona calisaya TaxID=153742 RepID=A0ABD3AUS3_9GENT
MRDDDFGSKSKTATISDERSNQGHSQREGISAKNLEPRFINHGGLIEQESGKISKDKSSLVDGNTNKHQDLGGIKEFPNRCADLTGISRTKREFINQLLAQHESSHTKEGLGQLAIIDKDRAKKDMNEQLLTIGYKVNIEKTSEVAGMSIARTFSSLTWSSKRQNIREVEWRLSMIKSLQQ